MERVVIKKQAKLIANSNRSLFTRVFIVYFLILLFSLVITYLGAYNALLLSFPLHDLIYLPLTPYTRAIVKILTALLSAPVFLLLNKAIYSLLDQKGNMLEICTVKSWVKDRKFLKKSLAFGIIICIFTVPFEMVGNFLNPHTNIFYTNSQWPWSILVPQFFYILAAILAFLLDFTYCIANLYPKKSARWVTITSVKLIFKNLFDYITFVLSFILWFSIELVGIMLLSIFAKNHENAYLIGILNLVFVTPFMMGIGFYFWPYFNIAKAIFCKELIKNIHD